MLRCSIALPSCINGTKRETSTCSAPTTASSLPSVFTIALAGRCRHLRSTPLISAQLSRIEDLALMSRLCPFCLTTALAAPAVAAIALLTSVSMLPARAQPAQASKQVQASQEVRASEASEAAKAEASRTTRTANVASVDQSNPWQQKSIAAKTTDKVKEVAKSAGDIFSRVPCLAPKGGPKPMGSL